MDLERNFFVISILSFVFPFFKSYFWNGRTEYRMKANTSVDTFYKIHDFFVTEYGLSGTELLVYAVIYSFCEKSKDGNFHGSRQYLAKRVNSCERNVQRALNNLCEKKLLTKNSQVGETSIYTCDKMSHQLGQNVLHTCDKMSHNNKDNNKLDILKENIKENLTEDGLDFSDIVIPKKNYCFRNGKKVYYSNKYDEADLDFLLE